MRIRYKLLLFTAITVFITSCRTLNTMQTSVVKKFAGTSKEITDLPYKLLYNYYSIEFKASQLDPENYVIKDSLKEGFDKLAENALLKIEKIRKDYYRNLRTASDVKTVYELLQTYINSLEKLADDKYAKDFEKKSVEMGNKMNGLVSKLNASPKKKFNLSFNPGQWLTAIVTAYGRTKLKTRQASFLRDYITKADTLVQAINQNFQDFEAPYLKDAFEEAERNIRGQFKQSIAPYLQYFNRHPDSTTTIVAIEFYSKIIPVYYELTEEIHKNLILAERANAMMNNLAYTHGLMKNMFNTSNNWVSVLEEVNGLKDKMSVLKDLFDKDGNDKFSFYKNFVMQDENLFKDIIDK
ncbi:MAG TPA: hypothetical protein VI461_04915 [Chitinophagaceae bacterium]|nr:hypothetical protein [Chitinophagaceae bacterium]